MYRVGTLVAVAVLRRRESHRVGSWLVEEGSPDHAAPIPGGPPATSTIRKPIETTRFQFGLTAERSIDDIREIINSCLIMT